MFTNLKISLSLNNLWSQILWISDWPDCLHVPPCRLICIIIVQYLIDFAVIRYCRKAWNVMVLFLQKRSRSVSATSSPNSNNHRRQYTKHKWSTFIVFSVSVFLLIFVIFITMDMNSKTKHSWLFCSSYDHIQSFCWSYKTLLKDWACSVLLVVTVDCRLLVTILSASKSHDPITFTITSYPANLIGPCDGWIQSTVHWIQV